MRQKWGSAKEGHSIIDEYNIDPYYLLQVVALLEPGLDNDGKVRAPSIKRGAILEMGVKQAQAGWDRAVAGLAEALTVLRDHCGVLAPGLLPYNTIVVPMAAILATQATVKGAQQGTNLLKVQRWFWCSVFGQRYENAPNSQAEKDFVELQRWLSGGDAPESVKDFNLAVDLKQVKPRQRAVYRGAMALVLQHGALDFHKRGKITSQLLADKKNPVDDHHIFPRAYCDATGIPSGLRDCILNRTFIDSTTNRRLSKRSPSDYFGEIRAEHGERDADALFHSHLIPPGADSPVLRDDFQGLASMREKAFVELIKQRTT
jgi:hypothetical protein